MATIETPGAVEVRSGDLAATLLPHSGMIVIGVRSGEAELLALPRSIDEYLAGGTTGMPLLHPFANRLALDEFEAYGARFDARTAPRDRKGLAIHGTMHGRRFTIERREAIRLTASCKLDAEVTFPFPHRVTVDVIARGRELFVGTFVENTGRRRMPVSFGWHPFFTLPGRPRADWTLRIPACRRAVLNDRLLPTGAIVEQPEDRSPIGDRTYDDHFELGPDRVFEVSDGVHHLRVEFDEHYPFSQIYLPHPDWPVTGDFVCIEPMVAPINALVTERAPTIAPGATYEAAFTIRLTASAT